MVSGTGRTAAGTACTGLSHPPAVLADRPHCLRRLTARQGRFTLGLWLDKCIFNPDVQIIATGPPRPAVRQWTAPPFPPFSAGSWPVPFARLFPFGLHVKRIRLTYSVFRLSPARINALNATHLCQPALRPKPVSI